MTSTSDYDDDFEPPLGSLGTVIGYFCGAGLVLLALIFVVWRIGMGRIGRHR